MKKMIKLISVIALNIIITSNLCVNAFAAPNSYYGKNDKMLNEIINIMIDVNESIGVEMSKKEIVEAKEEIRNVALTISQEEKISVENAYKNILNEMKKELSISASQQEITTVATMGARSKGDTEDAEEDVNLITLPEAEAGRIFFADMNSSWNHVGMYTSADTIIESMPEHGVYEASIYDDKTRQQCVDSGHDDSGIYKVKDATDEDVAEAIEWARGYIECEYDYDFVNNKKNTTDENKKFNCSELVWKAYRYGASSEIDLDSNGGKAVYPNNIINSSKTEYEKALR